MIEKVLAAASEGQKVPPTLLRNAAWAFSNLFRGKPAPSLAAVSPSLPVMSTLLGNGDSEVVVDVLWAVTYFTDSGEDRITHILGTDIVPKVITYLSCQDPTKQMPALRAVGNILTGTHEQTQAVLNMGALQPLFNLVSSNKRTLRKEACWAISNIAAGTPEQIQLLLTNEGMKVLYEILLGRNATNSAAQTGATNAASEANFDLKKEIAWVFANISSCCNEQQLKTMDPKIMISALCANLKIKEAKLIALSLLGIKRVLDLYDDNNENAVADYVDEIGGVEMIEDLQSHAKYEVYQTASDIITQYFCDDDNEEDVNFNANASQSTTFSFAAANPSSLGGSGNTFFN